MVYKMGVYRNLSRGADIFFIQGNGGSGLEKKIIVFSEKIVSFVKNLLFLKSVLENRLFSRKTIVFSKIRSFSTSRLFVAMFIGTPCILETYLY